MHSAQCVRNNKQPTKGFGEPTLIQVHWRPAEGKRLCSAAQRPCVPCILVTASKWRELGLGVGGGWAPAPALGDRDGLLAAPWRWPFRTGPWLPASLAPAPRTGPHCVQVANAFLPTLLRGLESGWDSGGGRKRGALCPRISLLPSASQGLFLLWVGCYVTDTGGSQATKHRSTVAYTIALQTVTNNFLYPSQIESSAWPSCFNTSHTYKTQGFTLCPLRCDRTGLHSVPGPGM